MSGFITCPKCESPVSYSNADIGGRITCGGCQQAIQLNAIEPDYPVHQEPVFPRGENSSVCVITAPEFQRHGVRIVETLNLVSDRRVFGANVLKDVAIGVRDFVGGRSKTVEKLFATAEAEILESLRLKAAAVGASALTDLRMQFGELGGKGSQLFFATGQATPVIFESVDDETSE